MNRDEMIETVVETWLEEHDQAWWKTADRKTVVELMTDFCLDYRRSGWVAVSDRLPSKKGRYLVRDKMNNPKDCVHIAYWSADRSRWMAITNHATDEAANKNIIEWMPIPPAPED